MSRVLVVDDAAFMRMSIKTSLEKAGHQVVGEAENGLRAIVEYRRCMPDLVTMDITMPEMDGVAGLKAIMQLDPNAKIIMLSAMGQEGMVKDAILNGAKTFVVKPFKEEHLIQVVNKVLAM